MLCDPYLEVVSDSQVGVDGDAHLLEVLGRPDTAQHEELRGVDGSRGHDHLLGGPDDVDLALASELDAVSLVGFGIDHDLEDVGVHGDVEVLALPDGPEEGLGRGAAGSSPDRSLSDHEARLVGTVPVSVLIAYGQAISRKNIFVKRNVDSTVFFRHTKGGKERERKRERRVCFT